MFRKGKGFLLPLVLVISVMVLGPALSYGQNPQVISAAYIDSINVLQIIFDQPVFTDSIHVIRTGITLDGDNEGSNPDVTLTGGFLSGIPELSDTVSIYVNFADQKSIETMEDRYELELVLAGNSFVNASYEGNAPLTVEDTIDVEFIPDMHPPDPIRAAYDANINRLRIIFDQVIDVGNISWYRISLDDDFDGPNLDVIFSSDNEEVLNSNDSDSIEIDVNPAHQQLIESFDTDSICLKLDRYAFLDPDRNSNKLITADDLIVSFIPDTLPTTVYSGHYDAGENKLKIFFSEKVITTFWGEEAVEYEGITVYDAVAEVGASLSGRMSVSVFADTTLVIEVLPTDQRLIESLIHKDALKLTLAAYSVLDADGNGIRGFTLEDNIPVTYEEEDPEEAPVVTEARYDAAKNVLELSFGNISGMTKGIDTVSVDLTGITLDDDRGGTNPDITLTGGEVHGIKAGLPMFIRKIQIEITPEDEARIERVAQKDSLYLILEPLTFFFESYTKTRNGNHILLTGEMPIQYQRDSSAAEIKSVKYDYLEDRLYLTFDKLIQYNEFQPTGIEISGVSLTGGTIRDSVHTSVITIDVNAADQANIKGLSYSDKTNLTVEVNAGTVLNLDDVPNANLSFQDGDTTAAGDTVLVGYGRKFWERSFETFPTQDKLIPASLRAIGEHSYFYVADSQWTALREGEGGQWARIITQAQVDSFRDAFEFRTPADANKGIYQICRGVFGEEKDTDGDSRIYALFLDLRDSFGVGGNARLSDYPKAGYFTPLNEQPDSVYAHSNQVDMIYIDTDPIIEAGTAGNALADMFQRMISHNVDPDEEQWLVEGLSALAQVVCGYGFSSYRFPAENPIPASGNVLTRWTGWAGGEDINLADLYNAFMFILYLYEQYGGEDGGEELLATIAADTANGLTSIDSSLSSKDTVTVREIFNDYALACFLNQLDHPTFGDKYGFETVELGIPGMTSITWKEDAYWSSGSQWAFSFFKTKEGDLPDFVKFNGNDESDFSFQVATIDSNFNLQKASLDQYKESPAIDLSGFSQDIVMVVCSKSEEGPPVSPFVINRDNSPSEYVNLSVFQNPSVDEVLDIYVVSKERLYLDLPYAYPATADEGPQVTVTVGNTSANLVAGRYFTNPEESMFSYHAELTLWGSGYYQIMVTGQDMSGNDLAPDTTTLTVRKILARLGGTISDELGDARLSLVPGSLAKDTYFTLWKVESDKAYRFGPANARLSKPATLTLKYDASIKDSSVAIYRLEGSQWVCLGGRVDRENYTITVKVDKLGEFQVRTGAPDPLETPMLPEVYSLYQNYPNPFNPETVIKYGLPEDSWVIFRVYNLLGQEIATLVHQHQQAGYHQIFWDAANLTSGVYFYKLEARNINGETRFSEIKKMIVLK